MPYLTFRQYLDVLYEARLIPPAAKMGEDRKSAIFHRHYQGELQDRGELFPLAGAVPRPSSSQAFFNLASYLRDCSCGRSDPIPDACALDPEVRRVLLGYIRRGRWSYLQDACFRFLPEGVVRSFGLSQLVRLVTLDDAPRRYQLVKFPKGYTPSPPDKTLPILQFVPGTLGGALDSSRLGAEFLVTNRPRTIVIVALS